MRKLLVVMFAALFSLSVWADESDLIGSYTGRGADGRHVQLTVEKEKGKYLIAAESSNPGGQNNKLKGPAAVVPRNMLRVALKSVMKISDNDEVDCVNVEGDFFMVCKVPKGAVITDNSGAKKIDTGFVVINQTGAYQFNKTDDSALGSLRRMLGID